MIPYLGKNPSHTQKKGWWSGSRSRPRVQAPVLQKQNKKTVESKKPLKFSPSKCRQKNTTGYLPAGHYEDVMIHIWLQADRLFVTLFTLTMDSPF
jgi:hypothetical protein